jgi:tetratricopeptide (TPR) repeat protein
VDPTNEHPYNGVGNALKDLKQFDEALVYYKKSIEVNPKYNFPYNGIANIYNEKRDVPEA